MNKNRRTRVILGGSLLVGVAALVIYGLVQLPEVATQLQVFSSDSLSINSPVNGGILFLNDPISIDLNAGTRDPVDRFQLWVDGVLTDTLIGEPRPSELFLYSISFPWLPAPLGEHTLIVRAVGTGWTLDSNAVGVNVLDPVAAMNGSQYFPADGETLGSIAAKFHLPEMLVALANPQIPGLADPINPSQPVLIPDLPLPVRNQGSGELPSGLPAGVVPDPVPADLSRFSTWFHLHLAPQPSLPPEAPILFGLQLGCDTRLLIRDNSDNELGFLIYRLNPGSSSFTRVATLGAHSGADYFDFLDKGVYGAFQYYVSAFNAAGESASNFTFISFPDPACQPVNPSAMLADSLFMRSSQVAEKAYCYYSLQEGFWSRYPLDPNGFVYPTDHGFDLTRMLADTTLPPLSQLSVECWGWSGGSLFTLGAASGQIGDIPGTSPLGGDRQLLDIDITISRIDWGGFVPALHPGLSDLSIVRITAPYNLTRTLTLETCSNHFSTGSTLASRTACEAAILDNMNILVWDWDSLCSVCRSSDYLPPSAISGYQIFESSGDSPPNLVATTTTGPWQTVVFLPQGDPLPGVPRRYFVRAFSDPYSSPKSNVHTWTELGAGIVSTFSYPTVTTDEVKEIASTCIFPDELPSSGLPAGFTVIGYQHLFNSLCGYEARYYRARFTFDLGEAKGHVILNSSLVYNQESGYSTTPGQSCAKSMLTVTSLSSEGSPVTSPLKELPTLGTSGASYSIDMTSLVDGWARGYKPNLGLLMVGRDETLPKTTYDSCWTHYSSFMLLTSYFK
jgi:hypothetical protein